MHAVRVVTINELSTSYRAAEGQTECRQHTVLGHRRSLLRILCIPRYVSSVEVNTLYTQQATPIHE